MRKTMKEAQKRVGVYRSMLYGSLLPSLCSLVLLVVVLIPLLERAASEADRTHENTLMYIVSSYFDGLLNDASAITNMIEQNPWFHEIYIDHVLNDVALSYEIKDAVTTDMGVLSAQQNNLTNLSFQFYGKEDEVYTSVGVFSNTAHYQEIAPQKICYFFFPMKNELSGFSTVTHQGREYLIYRDTLQDLAGGRDKGELNLIFREDILRRQLALLTGGEVASCRISDDSGRLLWEYGITETDEQVAAVSRMSGTGMYRYEINVPMSVHARTTNHVRPLMFIAVLIALTLCAVTAVALARMNYEPIKSIVRKFVGDVPEKDNEFVTLNRALDRILRDKSEIESELDSLRPLARQKLMKDLLDGTAFLGDSPHDKIHHCALQFDYEQFVVAAALVPFSRVSSAGTDEEAEELAMETLVEHCREDAEVNICLYYDSNDRYYLILNYNDPTALRRCLDRLVEKSTQYFLQTDCTAEPAFGVGSPVGSCTELYRSAEHASVALNYHVLNGGRGMSSYENMAADFNSSYAYPFSEEMLLFRSITENNLPSAKAIVNGVIQVNRKQSGLDPNAALHLYGDLCSTVIRSAQSVGITVAEETNEKLRTQLLTWDQVQYNVESLIEKVVCQIETRREQQASLEEERIMSYIEENLYDPNLSLGSIAERFHRSTTFVSLMFKEKRGVNYSDFVNQARIQRAVELLADGNSNSKQIYKEVGYISLTTFRRNFSKYTGKNPCDFSPCKEEHRTNENE